MDKYEEMLSRYKTDLDDAQVAEAVEKIVRDNLAVNSNVDVYKFLFNCIDLTSLHIEDNTESITRFTKRVNDFEEEHPDMPNVAAICVYPNFAGTVRANLDVSSVNIAAVSGGFPTSQTFTEVKVAETALAVGDGADEIDIVINVGNFLSGNYEEMCQEIEELEPFSISRDDIPPSEQSSYLSQDITIGEHTFYVENVQQGNGEYNGTIQMRKENSFIYNKTPLGHSQITITLLDTREEPYNPIMAELTVYYGEAENPSEMEAEVAKEEKGDGTVVCTYKLPSLSRYVRIANESSRAGYALSIEFGTDK